MARGIFNRDSFGELRGVVGCEVLGGLNSGVKTEGGSWSTKVGDKSECPHSPLCG